MRIERDPIVVHRQYTAGLQIAGCCLERCVGFGTNLKFRCSRKSFDKLITLIKCTWLCSFSESSVSHRATCCLLESVEQEKQPSQDLLPG